MDVLLVHGLGRTPASLFPLAASLRYAGHRTLFFGYSSTFESWDGIVRRLVKKLRSLRSPAGLVGHSLGGLLLRAALSLVPELNVRHFAMMGPPNRPPRLAKYFRKWRPFRVFAGSCGKLLATDELHATIPRPMCPTTIFAGTGGPRGRFSPFGNEANDGVVALNETVLEGFPPPVEFPLLHTWMMNDHRLRDAVVRLMAE